MPDDKTKRGEPDRSKVAAEQDYEINYLTEKHGLSSAEARDLLAAPLWVEDYCWAQAAQIRFNGRGEREAFIANCIANNIAEHTPPPAKTRYKKPR